jgi:hypothetical protein
MSESRTTTVQVAQNTAMRLRMIKVRMSQDLGRMITIDNVIQNLAQEWEAARTSAQNDPESPKATQNDSQR